MALGFSAVASSAGPTGPGGHRSDDRAEHGGESLPQCRRRLAGSALCHGFHAGRRRREGADDPRPGRHRRHHRRHGQGNSGPRQGRARRKDDGGRVDCRRPKPRMPRGRRARIWRVPRGCARPPPRQVPKRPSPWSRARAAPRGSASARLATWIPAPHPPWSLSVPSRRRCDRSGGISTSTSFEMASQVRALNYPEGMPWWRPHGPSVRRETNHEDDQGARDFPRAVRRRRSAL